MEKVPDGKPFKREPVHSHLVLNLLEQHSRTPPPMSRVYSRPRGPPDPLSMPTASLVVDCAHRVHLLFIRTLTLRNPRDHRPDATHPTLRAPRGRTAAGTDPRGDGPPRGQTAAGTDRRAPSPEGVQASPLLDNLDQTRGHLQPNMGGVSEPRGVSLCSSLHELQTSVPVKIKTH